MCRLTPEEIKEQDEEEEALRRRLAAEGRDYDEERWAAVDRLDQAESTEDDGQ